MWPRSASYILKENGNDFPHPFFVSEPRLANTLLKDTPMLSVRPSSPFTERQVFSAIALASPDREPLCSMNSIGRQFVEHGMAQKQGTACRNSVSVMLCLFHFIKKKLSFAVCGKVMSCKIAA